MSYRGPLRILRNVVDSSSGIIPELVRVVPHGLVVRLGQELVVQHAVREHEPGWGWTWTVNIFPPQQIFSAQRVTCRAPAPRV